VRWKESEREREKEKERTSFLDSPQVFPVPRFFLLCFCFCFCFCVLPIRRFRLFLLSIVQETANERERETERYLSISKRGEETEIRKTTERLLTVVVLVHKWFGVAGNRKKKKKKRVEL
jgi:hypothetical protein